MKNLLKVLRAERDWTQAQLAGALDVSRQTINAIETGKFDPRLPPAFRAAQLFGLRLQRDRELENCEPTESNGEWLSVADPEERDAALPLERRVGSSHLADGTRAEISLE